MSDKHVTYRTGMMMMGEVTYSHPTTLSNDAYEIYLRNKRQYPGCRHWMEKKEYAGEWNLYD